MKEKIYTIIVKKEKRSDKSISLKLGDTGKCDEDVAKMIINHLLGKIKRLQIQ